MCVWGVCVGVGCGWSMVCVCVWGVCVCVLLYISSRVQNTVIFHCWKVYPAVHCIISVCDISRTSWQQHGSVAPVADNAHTIQRRTPPVLWV